MKSCPTCSRTYPDDIGFCPHDATRLTAVVTGTEAQLAAGLSRRFRILRRLGAGGMGTVFLAEQIGVGNRPVALKVLNRKLLDDPEFLLRFQNEAGSTGRIHHPNVVTIHESAQAEDGTPYIAMEFLEGESLREALKKRGALPVAECAEVLQQTARGLNAAHKLGIIHRDLKPDNIFLTQGDEGELVVKVVDFGIAKLRESATHTQTGMVLGTPAYMSYEQASGMRSDELDARSDIYSLGVVTYEMLTGRVPFHSDTPLGYLRKHMMDDPPSFRSVAPGLPVPPQLETVVMKALTKDRDQRFASALEFAREFTRAVPPTAPSQELPPTRVVVLDEAQTQQERQARERAEAERLAREEAERERLAREKAEHERLTREKAEADRRQKAVAEAEHAARARVEQKLLEQERAVAERLAKERAEAERWSALPSETELRPEPKPAPPEPRPPVPIASGQEEKGSRAVIAGGAAAAVVVILAALVWVYWPSPNLPPGPQPGAPQQESSVPAKPETPVPAPNVNNPQGMVNPQGAQVPIRRAESLTRAKAKPTVGGVSGPPIGLPGGQMSDVTTGALQSTVAQPRPRLPEETVPKRMRVGGQIMSAKLIFRPEPEYPPLAKMARIQGVVRLDAIIGKDGTIQDLKVISGHPLLIKAALDAVSHWRYQPTLLNGEAVEVATEIDVNFTLSE